MRRKAFLFTFLVLSLLLAACVRSGGTEGENSYTIYYPAAELRDVPGEDAIVARTVQLPDADTLTQEELAQRLLERLLADAPDAGVRAPMPGGTTLLSLSVLGNWARVDFSRQYARLAGIDLTLADYCVTLTLTQLDGVNAVSITSGGRELPYRETQTLTAADPLLSMREDALRPITVSLYFLDPTSGALRAEKRALALYEGQTRVNALLEALAQGPESDALAALLPEEFTVLSEDLSGAELTDVGSAKPFYIEADTPAIKACIDTYNEVTGENATPFTMGGGTYARHFPYAVSFGPEHVDLPLPEFGGPMHGANEAAPIDKLLEALKIYIIALLRLEEIDF